MLRLMLKTTDQIIDALGGTVATARICGVSSPTVSNWRMRGGIPPERYFVITAALEAAGKPSPSKNLFGFIERPQAAE